MTLRLTSKSFAGTWRTLVAVGTVRLASIFVAITDDTPRSGSGSTTSNGVCSTGAKVASGRGARGGASGEIGSLIADLPLAETVFSGFGFNFATATAGT